MAKQEAKLKSNPNPTYEKLAGLPFESAKELKDAQKAVQMRVWRRLEEARILEEFLDREEFKFVREEFREGLRCGYGERSESLVRVFSEGKGIQIQINKDLADAIPSSETLLGVLVRAMSDSFAGTYYKAKGIMPATNPDEDVLQAMKDGGILSQKR
jgi:hypothetical protein